MTQAVEPTQDAGAIKHASQVEAQIAIERKVFRSVLVRAVVAVPFGMVLVSGLVALAVGDKDPDWGVWLGMSAGVGMLAGAFFGGLFGFITQAHVLDEGEHQHAAPRAE